MSDVEGLVVLTGEEPFDNAVHLTRDDEIKALIVKEGNGEEFVINNLHCKIKRNGSGAWCGYVGVDENHPWYGKGYSENIVLKDASDSINNRNPNNVNILSVLIDLMENRIDDGTCCISTAIDVHGGITFSDKFDDGTNLWYFGFDCNHCDDYAPAYSARFSDAKGLVYRTKDFVINECYRLVDQLLIVPYDSGE